MPNNTSYKSHWNQQQHYPLCLGSIQKMSYIFTINCKAFKFTITFHQWRSTVTSKKTHIQLFNSPLCGTTWVSWYQKKPSPTHNHEVDKEAFTQTTRSALSQRGLLDPIKPTYNQSRRLELTASTFNRLWISIPAVLVTVPTVMQNSLHPLSTSSITDRHLLDFMVHHPVRTISAPNSTIAHCNFSKTENK